MAKKVRPCLIVGNWKMYKTIDQAVQFVDEIAPAAEQSAAEVLLAVPFTAIKTLSEKVAGTKIVIGAQNMNDAREGAFTGEVAAAMLKEAGARFVLIGHSERRTIFCEDNAFINRKVLRALSSGIRPLLCIGESYEERTQNRTQEVLKEQLTKALEGVSADACKQLIIAYEPVWAIGSGLAATKELVEAAIVQCKEILEELFGADAKTVPLLYGGSVNSQNAENYLASDSIDGLLIGSASLEAVSFAKIISLRQNG